MSDRILNNEMLNKLAPGHYYGEKIRERALVDLSLSERLYAPGQTLSCHIHERAYLCLVVRGSYTETYGTRTCECTPTCLILHPEGERHADHFHQGGGYVFNVELGQSWAERIKAYTPVLSRRIEVQGGFPTGLMQRLYQESRRFDAAAPLVLEGMTLELLAAMAREIPSLPMPALMERRPPRWLEQARDLLHGQYRDTWTLTDIAASVDVHPVHLARSFRRHYRCTVGEYVRQLRVRFACTELIGSEKSLEEIAQEAGFADQSHFARMFKRLVGVSPAAYREAARTR